MRPPVTSDPLHALLAHNRWATHRVLDLCRPLSREQFHRRFEMGFGSLHNTMRHIVGCMRGWTDDIAARALRGPTKGPDESFSIDEFATLLDEVSDELKGMIETSDGRLGEHVYATFNGRRFTFTRGVVLTHVLVHGTHHRAQCLNMLRHLEVPGIFDKLPDLDVNDWQYETECKQ
jgi:uncharacterized damage-inducible protein DinB